MATKSTHVLRLVLAAMFLALALLLPFLTGQIPKIGDMLCPMHLPILLCGFFCGPWFGLVAGACAPLLRFVFFQMPPLYPTGVGMCFELAVYGFVSGLLYRFLRNRMNRYLAVYLSLFIAMLAGRAVWGIVRTILYSIGGKPFGMSAFLAGAFLNAIPGILLQLVLIPAIVIAVNAAFPKMDL